MGNAYSYTTDRVFYKCQKHVFPGQHSVRMNRPTSSVNYFLHERECASSRLCPLDTVLTLTLSEVSHWSPREADSRDPVRRWAASDWSQ